MIALWLKANWRFIAIPVAVLALCGALNRCGYYDGVAHEKAAQAKALELGRAVVASKETRAAASVEKTQKTVTARQVEIRTVTRTLIQKVPIYVPLDPARPSLSVGFVRLHDAAVLGRPDLADPAGRPDSAPSGFTDADLAGVVIENLGACRANAEALTGWQAWYADLQQNFNAK